MCDSKCLQMANQIILKTDGLSLLLSKKEGFSCLYLFHKALSSAHSIFFVLERWIYLQTPPWAMEN